MYGRILDTGSQSMNWCAPYRRAARAYRTRDDRGRARVRRRHAIDACVSSSRPRDDELADSSVRGSGLREVFHQGGRQAAALAKPEPRTS